MRISSLFLGLAAAVQAQTKTPINSTVWNTMIRYTHFQAASAFTLCPTPPYGTKIVARPKSVYLDRELTIFQDDKAQEVIISIPGTNFSSPQDIANALTIAPTPFVLDGVDCPNCTVPAGPLNAWIALENDVKSTLDTIKSSHPSYKIVITGHSLGASIAAIGYLDLKKLGYNVVRAYTFGQARTGNAAFGNKIDQVAGNSNTTVGAYWRITHAMDPVPGLVPQGPFNKHEMIEFWQQNGAPNVTSQALTSRCYGDEPADCINSIKSTNVSDHLTYTNINLMANNVSCYGVN